MREKIKSTKIQNNFDTLLDEWKEQLETPRYTSNLNELVFTVNKYMKKNGSVLEIGGGLSKHIQYIKSKEKYVLDISKKLISLNKLGNATFLVGDVLKLPKNFENKFDVIFCNGLIHHIQEHQLLIDNIKRCLKLGGLFIFLEPTSISLSGFYFYLKHFLLKIFTKDKIIKMSGFIDEQEKYINYFSFRKLMNKNNFIEIKYYTRQLIRLPPIKLFKNINVEKINNKINVNPFGTTLVGVFLNNS